MSSDTARHPPPPGRDIEYEMDSLHILPLHFLPMQTPGLAKARMIKNVQFESMVEVFHDNETGSGQVDPSKLSSMFDWPKGSKHPDGVLIAKLGLLQSFDVYTLRMSLRSLGIKVDNIADLRLSDSKRRELSRYMRVFTRPLINLIYAENENVGISDISDLMATFRDQDNKVVLENLKRMSSKLKVILSKLPVFLMDYGDVFLSLAYFKDRLDDIDPKSSFLLDALSKARNDELVRGNAQMMSTIEAAESDLEEIISAIHRRIASFDMHTESMWKNLTSESFREVKMLIESNHATIGGMLCGLQIKMDGFYERFHEKDATGRQIADFISMNIKPGIDKIKNIERSAHYANKV